MQDQPVRQTCPPTCCCWAAAGAASSSPGRGPLNCCLSAEGELRLMLFFRLPQEDFTLRPSCDSWPAAEQALRGRLERPCWAAPLRSDGAAKAAACATQEGLLELGGRRTCPCRCKEGRVAQA